MKFISFQTIKDKRGDLSVLEGFKENNIQFENIFWVYKTTKNFSINEKINSDEIILVLKGEINIQIVNNGCIEEIDISSKSTGIFLNRNSQRKITQISNKLVILIIRNKSKEDKVFKLNNEFKIRVNNFNFNSSINYINSTVDDCIKIKLSNFINKNFSLCLINNYQNNGLKIKRIYYLHNVPKGSKRGGHAHIKLYQYIIAVSGDFDVKLFDGKKEKTVHLNRQNVCLKIVPGIWREILNFSNDSICLVLASEYYDELDYIRSKKLFQKRKC